MTHTNNINGWVMTVVGGVLAAGILSAVAGYGEDQRRDERMTTISATVQENKEEVRKHHDAIMETANHLENIDGAIERMAAAMEKLAEDG